MSATVSQPVHVAAVAGVGRTVLVLVGLSLGLIAAGAARLMIGETIGWPSSPEVLAIRFDRLQIGATLGAALAVCGAILQALLRNPLASPYILGVSSGAFLGVMASWVGWLWFLGPVNQYVAALLGAGVTLLIVYGLAQQRGRIDPLALLLVGVIVNAINSAAIMFINYLVPHGQRGQMALWLMGYLNENIGGRGIRALNTPAELGVLITDPLLLAIAVTLIGIVVAAGLGRAMDAASFSDAEAHSLGVNLPRLRLWLFLLAGVLTAVSVMLAGPIGFIGLIAPHAVRMLLGPANRPLIVGSALAGAMLVVGADTLIKLLDVGSGLMPIGVITGLVGGPTFLFMLRSELKRRLHG